MKNKKLIENILVLKEAVRFLVYQNNLMKQDLFEAKKTINRLERTVDINISDREKLVDDITQAEKQSELAILGIPVQLQMDIKNQLFSVKPSEKVERLDEEVTTD